MELNQWAREVKVKVDEKVKLRFNAVKKQSNNP